MNQFIRHAGVFEVVAVFIVGSFVASIFYQWAGITGHPLMAITQENPDMFAIGIEMGKVLLLQYSGFLLLGLVFTLAQRQHLLKDRGITFNGHTLLALIGIGILGWSLGDLPQKVLWVLDAQFDLGQSVPWREALFNAEPTAGWWFLLFVGSFGLVPIVEEVFWRGYVQGRLQQFLSPTTAIVLTSTMFTLSHGQYHHVDVYHITTILGLFVSSFTLGWLYHKTGSLVPAIVMHALLNFPTFGIWSYLAIAVMLFLIARHWQTVKAELNHVLNHLKTERFGVAEVFSVAFLALCMLALTQWQAHVFVIGWSCLFIAVAATIVFNWLRYSTAQKM